MLSWLTKNPANSMKGMMRTGVRVTASYLSEKRVLITNAYAPAEIQILMSMATIKNYGGEESTEQWELVPEDSTESDGIINNATK